MRPRDQPAPAEIRAALTTLRKFMAPGLYEQLDAQLSARENQWPLSLPPPFEADDENRKEPDA